MVPAPGQEAEGRHGRPEGPLAEASAAELEEASSVFALADRDGSGLLSWRELAGSPGFRGSRDDARGLVRAADEDGDGLLRFEEFAAGFLGLG